MAQDTGDAAPSEDQEHETSALLPKSLFNHECKPGDVYRVRVTDVYDDEISVEAVGEEDKKEPAGDESDMAKSKASLDSYAKTPEEM
jgi:exosome complex RNA-binding protein Csl4